MNFDMLKELLPIFSPSGLERETGNYIKKVLVENNIKFEEDEIGNIWNISNQSKPILSAHQDTVLREQKLLIKYPFVCLKDKQNYDYIWTEDKRILGGDDRCGIFIILSLLKENKDLNFLFTVKEEVGALGAKFFLSKTKETDFVNIPYCLVLDRQGDKDIVCASNFYGTKEFENVLCEAGKQFDYSQTVGLFSDCNVLNRIVSTANISCGYFNAHTPKEFICLQDVEKSFNFIKHCIETVKDIFPSPKKEMFDYFYTTTFNKTFEKRKS